VTKFFFSSRRRHTSFDCDWSSDVCSSDLRVLVLGGGDGRHAPPFCTAHFWNAPGSITITRERISAWPSPQSSVQMTGYVPAFVEIGRASCRERGCETVVAEAIAEKHAGRG